LNLTDDAPSYNIKPVADKRLQITLTLHSQVHSMLVENFGNWLGKESASMNIQNFPEKSTLNWRASSMAKNNKIALYQHGSGNASVRI
jgi:hypothetical protein